MKRKLYLISMTGTRKNEDVRCDEIGPQFPILVNCQISYRPLIAFIWQGANKKLSNASL